MRYCNYVCLLFVFVSIQTGNIEEESSKADKIRQSGANETDETVIGNLFLSRTELYYELYFIPIIQSNQSHHNLCLFHTNIASTTIYLHHVCVHSESTHAYFLSYQEFTDRLICS